MSDSFYTGRISWSPDFERHFDPACPDFATVIMTPEMEKMIEKSLESTNLSKQILKDTIFMNITHEYANFSKCTFTKVGAIAINENERIIATGVNGTLPGQRNCCDHHFPKRDDHVVFTQQNEIHAEANLILDMVKSHVSYKKLTIYITISPCYECLKLLLSLNRKDEVVVERIVYGEKYHRTTDAELNEMIQKAKNCGTKLEKAYIKDL